MISKFTASLPSSILISTVISDFALKHSHQAPIFWDLSSWSSTAEAGLMRNHSNLYLFLYVIWDRRRSLPSCSVPYPWSPYMPLSSPVFSVEAPIGWYPWHQYTIFHHVSPVSTISKDCSAAHSISWLIKFELLWSWHLRWVAISLWRIEWSSLSVLEFRLYMFAFRRGCHRIFWIPVSGWTVMRLLCWSHRRFGCCFGIERSYFLLTKCYTGRWLLLQLLGLWLSASQSWRYPCLVLVFTEGSCL